MSSNFSFETVGDSLRVVEGLSWAQLALGLAGLTITWYLISSVVAWNKLRHIPGPFFASFSDIWCWWVVYSGRSHIVLKAEHEKHGDLWRVAPTGVATSDPETIIRINAARSPYTRGSWYGGARIDPHGDSLITELDSTKHGKRKSKLATGFSGKNLSLLEAGVDKWIAVLMRSIRAKIEKGDETIDIGKLIQYFQVDMIAEIEMGSAWGNLHDDVDHFGYLKMSDFVVPAVQAFAFLPLARTIITSSWFMNRFGPSPTDTKGLGLFLGIVEKEVKSRFENSTGTVKESCDLLDEWVKHGISPTEAQYDLSLMIPAGTETSVMMMRGTLLLLMSSPAVYQRLKQEIREGIADGRISTPVTNEESKSLEYTQAVLREGLRLMTPINFGFPKRVPETGDTINGIFLPAGTDVYLNFSGMMRRKEVFGDDVEVFRPERFLSGGPEVANMIRVVDAVFGGGRFMCLGKVLAIQEINKIFVELFRYFDFQIATPEKPWRRNSYTTWTVYDFLARITEDKTMA
ncbi:putative cytochrome P450 [Rosellinia necatrix]|uniref:Putative cytochrome P450 n=1 Tax=Rosellinia necatrix TaxID=77044 RepID=A0A1S7UKD4_ROSNE|nr:putative cytochrome P450 [Rosellinia necatrix]